MQSIYEQRLRKFQEGLVELGLDAAFLPISGDLQYLTGVLRPLHKPTNDNKHGDELYGAFITPTHGPVFIAPLMGASEYVRSQAEDKPWIEDIVILNDWDSPLAVAKDMLKRLGNPTRIGVNARQWARSRFLLQEAAPSLEFTDVSAIIAPMRATKDEAESTIMQAAGVITDQIFAQVIKTIRPGVTDYELTREIDYQAMRHGASGMSFHTKVVIGGSSVERRYFPDGKTSNTPVSPGSAIAFDFGIIYKGYASDFGRTVFCDQPNPELTKMYGLVIAAQEQGMQAMCSGKITAAQLNTVMRQPFIDQGFGDFMGMRFGHGIGIDVHEPPFLFQRDHTVLQEGMCLTLEPSLRLPTSLWIRVEDVVQVTEAGGRPFTNFSRDLMIV